MEDRKTNIDNKYTNLDKSTNDGIALTEVQLSPAVQPNSVYTPTVVTQQPKTSFGTLPQPAFCPSCGSKGLTTVGHTNGKATILAAVVCCMICPLLIAVPFISTPCKDVEHSCPKCGAAVGKHELLHC
eukprot:gene1284-15670_t